MRWVLLLRHMPEGRAAFRDHEIESGRTTFSQLEPKSSRAALRQRGRSQRPTLPLKPEFRWSDDPRSPGSVVDEIKVAIAADEISRARAFDHACAQNSIEHRLIKSKYMYNNKQSERIKKIIKQPTAKRFYYEAYAQLQAHLADFADAYNYAGRLKMLGSHALRGEL